MFNTYVWEWTNHKVSIRTFLGLEEAIKKAQSYFPNDEFGKTFISTNSPQIIPDPEVVPAVPAVVEAPVVSEVPEVPAVVEAPVVSEVPQVPVVEAPVVSEVPEVLAVEAPVVSAVPEVPVVPVVEAPVVPEVPAEVSTIAHLPVE